MGRLRKWKRYVCLLAAALFALTWMSGCRSEKSVQTKETIKTDGSENLEAGKEEIPEELLPGKGRQSESGNPDSQGDGSTKSAFDAADEEEVTGGDIGGQVNSAGNEGGQEPAEASEIQISITVESQAVGNLVSYGDVLTLKRGATAYDALTALLGEQVAASGGYVTGIGGLSEKDYGAKSGWMYSVNGTRPNKGSSSYTLQDGDEVVWSYVT